MGFGNLKRTSISLGAILGIISGTAIAVILCVGLIICCVAPCCLLYKKCRQRHNERQSVRSTTVVNTPMQPLPPSGHHPTHPGYLPVPVQPGYGRSPNPTAPPPSYSEATGASAPPVSFSQGQLMYPYPSQPSPHTDDFAPLPYNPSYYPNS
ncbi:uncharacterized protein V6R79_005498 [Siganus canaliculatus]